METSCEDVNIAGGADVGVGTGLEAGVDTNQSNWRRYQQGNLSDPNAQSPGEDRQRLATDGLNTDADGSPGAIPSRSQVAIAAAGHTPQVPGSSRLPPRASIAARQAASRSRSPRVIATASANSSFSSSWLASSELCTQGRRGCDRAPAAWEPRAPAAAAGVGGLEAEWAMAGFLFSLTDPTRFQAA